MRIPGNKVFFWLCVTGLIILIIGLLFAFVFFDLIINGLIYRNVRLKEGTLQYERWEELPLDVNYKVYLFNVTNPEEVSNGEKPDVKEVGPYIYKQSRHKENITYNEDEDTYQYLQYTNFTFDANASYPFEEEDTILMVNVIQNTFFQIISNLLTSYGISDSITQAILFVLDYGGIWSELFADTDTVFHEVRVGDILFNGQKFCEPSNLNEYSIYVCEALKLLNLEVLDTEEDGSLSFAFFKNKQNQHDGWYVVGAGINDVSKLGLIYSWEGRAQLDTWNGLMSRCNKVTGRDSTIYPPNIEKEDTFDIFATDICRAAEIYYTGEDEVGDIPGQKRLLRENYFDNTEENECFCLESTFDLHGEQNCLPDGFFDLQPCLGAPLVASFPHFLYGDGEYSNTTTGLEPVQDAHQTYVILEPKTGTPLEGYKRLQFNAILRSIEGIRRTNGVANSVLPILWVEEGMQISEEYIDELQTRFITPLKIVEIFKWIIVGVGAAMTVIFGGLYCIYL